MDTTQTTFVCCIESGWLEAQTLRMIESLRRWGGRYAEAPVYAITPRFGAPISKSTRLKLEQLQVQYISFINKHKYSWNKFLNKLLSLTTVEKIAKTEYIAWLDSDLLIVDEPLEFIMDSDKSFLACPSDKLSNATGGTNDPNEPYWREICKCVGLDIEALPWINSEPEHLPIRFCFNSGVFIYRRSTNFAQYYLDTFTRLCDSHIISNQSGLFFNDQLALGLTVAKVGIPWDTLSYSHNFAIGSVVPPAWYNPEHLQTAKIIHYHDAMWPQFWDTFYKSVNDSHPAVGEWLAPLGSMKTSSSIGARAMKKMLDLIRKRKEVAYCKLCQSY
ncbi:hypothetical protein NIES4071_84000 [Calothrix sp. NIES-4071]|nr:hypothetical protein NIES4071_84000 [Calothrix sp. NIES-4071]BAZ62668.1 hypothetical protein NIES4105_83930 [Calothrix sp. NIES-4105]